MGDCIPSFDASDYLNRGLDLDHARSSGGWWQLVNVALTPDVHPPAHPLWLALGAGAGARSLEALSAFMTWTWVLGLLLVLAWGASAAGRGGLVAGSVAVGLITCAAEHLRLAPVPMTENLSFVSVAVVLILGGRLTTHVKSAVVGLALLTAGLVRYSAIPLLGLPLVAHVLWESRGRPVRTRLLHILALLGPSVVFFLAWGGLRPRLWREVRRFFTNVDSGLPFWSVENWLWVPETLAGRIWGEASLVWGMGLLSLAGMVMAWRPAPAEPSWRAPVRLVQLVLLVGVAAYTAHPYKLERALHGLAPLVAMTSVVPVLGLVSARRAWIAMGAATLGIVAAAAARGATPPDPAELRGECVRAPSAARALTELTQAVRGAERVAILGANEVVSAHVVRLWLRTGHAGLDVFVLPPLSPDCASSEASAPDPRCVPPGLVEALSSPPSGLVVLTTGKRQPGPRRREGRWPGGENRHWSLQAANIASDVAARESAIATGTWPLGRDGRGEMVLYLARP